jgi:AcrR family transcriptional regulator
MTVPDPRRDARATLLEAASLLMRERDSLDLSLSEIAAQAGLNAALVKYYFGNKAGMMEALLERDVGPQVLQLAALVALPISPVRRMRMHIEAMISLYCRLPYLNRLLITLMGQGAPQRAQRLADRYVTPIIEAYRTLIAEGVDRGELKPMEPELLYFNIIGACDPFLSARTVLPYAMGGRRVDDDLRRRYVAQTTELLLRGMTPPPELR